MHCDFPPAAKPASLWWRQAPAQSTSPTWKSDPLIVGKPAIKTLSSLGYAIVRFLESHKPLIRHVQKNAHGSMTGLSPWLSAESAATPVLENAQGLFGTALGWDGHSISVQRLWLSPEELAAAIQFLPKGDDPDHHAIPENVAFLDEPPHANSAIWPALLRLPLLKDYWGQQLRSNLLETLLQVLPFSWLLDPAPVPNGAVIAGLNLPSWESFDQSPAGKHHFAITPAFASAHNFAPISASDISSALAQYPGQAAVLSPAPADARNVIFAIYQQSEKGVALLRTLHLHRSESGDQITAGDVIAK